MAKIKFHKQFIVRENGKDTVIKAGVHDIKEKASIERWLRRGCELIKSKKETEAELKAKKQAEENAEREAEENAALEAEIAAEEKAELEAKIAAEEKAKLEAEQNNK